MGSPDFAAIILRRLLDSPLLDICGVCTQPDRPAGRGRKNSPPPVKIVALDRSLPLLQAEHFKADAEGDAAFVRLADWTPDLLIVAAYGLILPRRVLDLPRMLPLNVHASLLPRHRGAAPIQRALLAGDFVTGISIMRMVSELDAGPILLQRAVGIDIAETYQTLHDELAGEGAELLLLAIERLRAGKAVLIDQDAGRATYAPKITRLDCPLDFSQPAAVLHAHIRALYPKPGATMLLHRPGREDLQLSAAPGIYPLPEDLATFVKNTRIRLHGGVWDEDWDGFGDREWNKLAGRVLGLEKGVLLVACADGAYAFSSLRPAGKKSMDAGAFANGYLGGCALSGKDGVFFSAG
jgi:methionyl-tRNA formyltransferase